YISQCEVYVLELHYAPAEIRSAFRDLFKGGMDDRKALFNLEKNYAIESKSRLEFVTEFVLKNPKNTLVLFHRIEYGKALYESLRSKT
ncbi:hypothetical protein U2088_15585, partial [Listeria monocytogenes]|uniref:hypothetical protein n=1 Tax=Listeria monocytogenes TaxID=1639 RepID=UPI002FDC4305